MKFWKENASLRMILMLVTFVVGIFLVVFGWKQTGKLWGLGLMLLGVAVLLVTLWLYNAAYADKTAKQPKKKKPVK